MFKILKVSGKDRKNPLNVAWKASSGTQLCLRMVLYVSNYLSMNKNYSQRCSKPFMEHKKPISPLDCSIAGSEGYKAINETLKSPRKCFPLQRKSPCPNIAQFSHPKGELFATALVKSGYTYPLLEEVCFSLIFRWFFGKHF